MHFFPKKVDKLFLVVTLKIQVFTTNAQNTLQFFQGGGQVPSKHFIFFRRGAYVFIEGGRAQGRI